jgi:hypothetical protein
MDFRHRRRRAGEELVWRISADAPGGAWVDSNCSASPAATTESPAVPSGSWASSSLELLHGADVCEFADTVPVELIDKLLQPGDVCSKVGGKQCRTAASRPRERDQP